MIQNSSRLLLSLAFAFALLPAACGDDDEEFATTGGAQRGESCRSRLDCAADLACVQNRCSVRDFPISPTGKECVSIECLVPEDCCPPPSALCQSLKASCDLGNTSACDQYATSCACRASDWLCENDECFQTCTGDLDCTLGACVGGKCVECGTDTDCAADELCKDGICEEKCTEDADCAYFHSCQGGTCVPTGCNNDRECVGATGNVLAFCLDQECRVPCQSDVECDQQQPFDFNACIDGFCVELGCEGDDECRILLNVQPNLGPDAVCREKAVP